jgi:hypothetical protein
MLLLTVEIVLIAHYRSVSMLGNKVTIVTRGGQVGSTGRANT